MKEVDAAVEAAHQAFQTDWRWPTPAERAALLLQREAPYIGLQSSVPRPRLKDRPSAVTMQEAVALGTDVGEGRIREMDDHGIQMQVVSWISPAQLVPADQAVSLTGAANDRLAEAIRANPTRLSGFAVLPWQEPAMSRGSPLSWTPRMRRLTNAARRLAILPPLLGGTETTVAARNRIDDVMPNHAIEHDCRGMDIADRQSPGPPVTDCLPAG